MFSASLSRTFSKWSGMTTWAGGGGHKTVECANAFDLFQRDNFFLSAKCFNENRKSLKNKKRVERQPVWISSLEKQLSYDVNKPNYNCNHYILATVCFWFACHFKKMHPQGALLFWSVKKYAHVLFYLTGFNRCGDEGGLGQEVSRAQQVSDSVHIPLVLFHRLHLHLLFGQQGFVARRVAGRRQELEITVSAAQQEAHPGVNRFEIKKPQKGKVRSWRKKRCGNTKCSRNAGR